MRPVTPPPLRTRKLGACHLSPPLPARKSPLVWRQVDQRGSGILRRLRCPLVPPRYPKKSAHIPTLWTSGDALRGTRNRDLDCFRAGGPCRLGPPSTDPLLPQLFLRHVGSALLFSVSRLGVQRCFGSALVSLVRRCGGVLRISILFRRRMLQRLYDKTRVEETGQEREEELPWAEGHTRTVEEFASVHRGQTF